MSQLSLLSIAQYRKTLRCERFLQQMDQVVPWKKLCEIIKPYHQEPPTGRKPIAVERKLRIICLQQWFNLSDPGVEDAIYDRNSFQKFLSIDILTELCRTKPQSATFVIFCSSTDSLRKFSLQSTSTWNKKACS